MSLMENGFAKMHGALCAMGFAHRHATLTPEEKADCMAMLRQSQMFWGLSDQMLEPIADMFVAETYSEGSVLIREGTPHTRFFVIADGTVRRTKIVQGVPHVVDESAAGNTIGILHALTEGPCYAAAIALTDVKVYASDSACLVRLLRSHPQIHFVITTNLCRALRESSRKFRTPLFEIRGTGSIALTATSLAAAFESFYRSALNAVLNNLLLPNKTGRIQLFPNMHVQLPCRVMYINGFKILRSYFDSLVPEKSYVPWTTRAVIMISPGIIMCPMSSLLEACNATSNTEPLQTRWMRGFLPRTVREIIFGIGLNQMSDFFEERVPDQVSSKALRSAVGSMTAGVCSGYLSHVPHNMSALKLMKPWYSYAKLFEEFASLRLPQLERGGLLTDLSEKSKFRVAAVVSCLFPRGVLIRTTQIVGSFMIINGTIEATRGKFKELGLP